MCIYVFFFYEFMEDVTEKLFIPEHQLLSEEEKEEFKKSFSLHQIGNLQKTDKMCRYYNGQIGDIFRIIRPNLNSGESIYYRKVTKGNLELLFS